jgi:uncharacterized membrane protein YidH (DUF202 family)
MLVGILITILGLLFFGLAITMIVQGRKNGALIYSLFAIFMIPLGIGIAAMDALENEQQINCQEYRVEPKQTIVIINGDTTITQEYTIYYKRKSYGD